MGVQDNIQVDTRLTAGILLPQKVCIVIVITVQDSTSSTARLNCACNDVVCEKEISNMMSLQRLSAKMCSQAELH
jgi:hypothetical protein